MKKRLLVVISIMLALCLSACGQSSGSIQNNGEEIITVDKMEITLDLHHDGQRAGIYSGEMKNNLPNGNGSFETESDNGNIWTYEGEWVDGQMEGQGKITWPDVVMTEEGTFVDSEIVNGTVTYNGAKFYEGEWKNQVYDGQGTFYNPAGDIIYSGTFSNGFPSEIDKIKESAKEVSYDSLLNEPELNDGNIIKVQGKIFYVWEDEDNYCEYIITTDEDDDDAIYVAYMRHSDEERQIKKDEYVTAYGISDGLYTYDTVEDTTATIPFMTMLYYE